VVRAGIVAAAVVVAVVAVLVAPQGHSGGVVGRAEAAILSRARAAIGTGQIVHVVTEGPAGTQYVDLRTGRRTPAVLTEEFWANRHGHRLHLVERVNGRVVGELHPGDPGVGVYQGPNTPALVALWSRYKTALQNKYAPAELGGRGTVEGHSVYWLRFPVWFNQNCPRPTKPFCGKPTRLSQTKVAVDAHTFKPVLERTYEDGRRFDLRILVAEAISYRPPELYRRLGPKLFTSTSPGHPFRGNPFAGVTRQEKNQLGRSGRDLHRLRRLEVVPAPWLTAGTTVAGLRFRSVSRLLAQPLDQVGGLPMAWRLIYRAVKVVYKPATAGPFTTTAIAETFRPADPRPWTGLPPGSVEIQPGESVTKSGAHRLWTGYLVKHGVYITITTPAGEHTLLEIARALHRAHP
jgi:hypothetical protein